MPTFRLSTGKTVSPLRRPKLAAVRDLELNSSQAQAAAEDQPIALQSGRAPDLGPAVLHASDGQDVVVTGLAPPPVERRQTGLRADDVGTIDVAGWPEVVIERVQPPEPVNRGRLARKARTPQRLWANVQRPVASATGRLAPDPRLRPHQIEAAQALLTRPTLFLADDPGTGKAESACLALAGLVQTGQVGRALLLSPPSRILSWQENLSRLAPGLYVGRAAGPRLEARGRWAEPHHLLLCDYVRAADDLPRLMADKAAPEFDLIIADSALTALHKTPQGFRAIADLMVPRRWALAGGPPEQAEEWRALCTFLLPGQPIGRSESAVELQERLGSHIMRRTKRFLAGELPTRLRQEQWLELDPRQTDAYRTALAEERHMLSRLGESTTRTHIDSALGTLNRTTAFAQGSLDGVKVRALTDLLEAIAASGDKALLFSQYRHRALEPLQQALHAYGGVLLPESAGESERSQILGSFRRDPKRRILLAHLDSRSDGEPLPASYLIHFDVSWNSARRIRAEQRFFPQLKPDLPLTIYEFWVAGSHDETLHDLLAAKGLLASDLPQGTQPAELEDRLTVDDWQRHVFATTAEPVRVKRPAAGETTGLLPGTSALRLALDRLEDPELRDAVRAFMAALGFPHSEPVQLEAIGGISLISSAETGESVLVHLLRSEGNLGVGEGRVLLQALDDQADAQAAYLVATADFTPACKKLAEESNGRLALVSGIEFFRHLRILGWV